MAANLSKNSRRDEKKFQDLEIVNRCKNSQTEGPSCFAVADYDVYEPGQNQIYFRPARVAEARGKAGIPESGAKQSQS